MLNILYKIGLIVCAVWSLYWPSDVAAFDGEELGFSSLKERYGEDFFIGGALKKRAFQDERSLMLLRQHFNVITTENAMKWSVIHPEKYDYRFERADAIVDFAQQHGLKVIGHTLIWEYKKRTPDWVVQGADGEMLVSEQVLEHMREHIMTVVTRYKGRIHGWDVVNEALDDPRREIPETGEEYYSRANRYRQILGNEYIVKAFEFAQQADPDAELYYNDYFFNRYINGLKKVRDAVELIRWLQKQGVRLDGVGIQGHWTLTYPPVEEVEEAILSFAALGIQVMITELDIRLWSGNEYDEYLCLPLNVRELLLRDKLELQARRYEELFQLFDKHRAHISRVTLWGSCDQYSWAHKPSHKGFPLLFDEHCVPKPALDRIMNISVDAMP